MNTRYAIAGHAHLSAGQPPSVPNTPATRTTTEIRSGQANAKKPPTSFSAQPTSNRRTPIHAPLRRSGVNSARRCHSKNTANGTTKKPCEYCAFVCQVWTKVTSVGQHAHTTAASAIAGTTRRFSVHHLLLAGVATGEDFAVDALEAGTVAALMRPLRFRFRTILTRPASEQLDCLTESSRRQELLATALSRSTLLLSAPFREPIRSPRRRLAQAGQPRGRQALQDVRSHAHRLPAGTRSSVRAMLPNWC